MALKQKNFLVSTSPTRFGVFFYPTEEEDVDRKGRSRKDQQIDGQFLLNGDEGFVMFKSVYLLYSAYAYHRLILHENNFAYATIEDVTDHVTFESGNRINLAMVSLIPAFVHNQIKRLMFGLCSDKDVHKILECMVMKFDEEVAQPYSPSTYAQKCIQINKILKDIRMACSLLPALPRGHTPFLMFETFEAPINASIHFHHLMDVNFEIILAHLKPSVVGAINTKMGDSKIIIYSKSPDKIREINYIDLGESKESSSEEELYEAEEGEDEDENSDEEKEIVFESDC
uniref:Uncharacterized protein n=1 Tax=Panagrolaimus davidi TaxID=227884 RepID=A0A914R0F0_9BILA